MPTERACQHCTYWWQRDDNFYGDCRLNPPVVFELPAEKHATVAPSSIRDTGRQPMQRTGADNSGRKAKRRERFEKTIPYSCFLRCRLFYVLLLSSAKR
jgi:hypothetical protein